MIPKKNQSKVCLIIDSRHRYNTKVTLINSRKKYNISEDDALFNSPSLLQLIDKALKKSDLKMNDIHNIKVETDGGSFTGVRIGLAVANTLGWIYSIPVNSQPHKIITSDFE